MSAAPHASRTHFDPYRLDPRDILEPPVGLANILRKIGPGIVLAASIVGSGELIATTALGAKVGYTMLWLVIVSCLIKSVVQAFLGRYVIARAETGLDAVNHIPGPRTKHFNWVIVAWAIMVFLTLFQIAAMFIGVSQVMFRLTDIAVGAWVIIFWVLTLVLLLGGGYARMERLAMVKVGLFTLITLLAAVLLMTSPSFSVAEMASGFRFELPSQGMAIAIAVFGITGVGATELYIYTYWCVEKGYARYTGPYEDGEAWRRRARGWAHVMNVDVVFSMIIYTVATVAFYLLGAGILHAMGQVPNGAEMIDVLSNIYTQTLGGWARYLFYVGAIIILFGTIVAATAGHSRMCSDLMRILGQYDKDDLRARNRWRDVFVVVLTVIPVVMFWIFGQAPVQMVTWGGMAQAAMLPIISCATLYLYYRHMRRTLVAPGWMVALLWIAAIFIIGFVIPSLAGELKKMFG
ncbi:MAG: Nramp family divalent metal transporter [Betaproteobacteria bacterium]|nr:Nramp family divalent metal transporter [Betaproteobacteria bacterium]MBL8533634.1 Nramp family divalent metal transporter [Betaproteobacteria bacterium]